MPTVEEYGDLLDASTAVPYEYKDDAKKLVRVLRCLTADTEENMFRTYATTKSECETL